MASAATLGSTPAGAIAAKDTITIRIGTMRGIEGSLEMSPSETLTGLIEKMTTRFQTQYHVGLCWNGREDFKPLFCGPTVQRSTASAFNQYQIHWENCGEPKIELTGGSTGGFSNAYIPVPARIKELTGVQETEKMVKVARDLFTKLKVTDVCDLRHSNLIHVMVYAALPVRATAVAASSPLAGPVAQSSLSSARVESKTKA